MDNGAYDRHHSVTEVVEDLHIGQTAKEDEKQFEEEID